jgi:hypothetical protein
MNGHPHLGRRSLRDKTMKNPIFLSVIAILSSVLFGTVHAGKFQSYDDCILESMKGVTSDYAAAQITKACRSQYPQRGAQLIEIEREDWNIKVQGAWLATGFENIMVCGSERCFRIEFLNRSDRLEIKKLLVRIEWEGFGTPVMEYYAEPEDYTKCSPHRNCKFTLPLKNKNSVVKTWAIKRVWGSWQH